MVGTMARGTYLFLLAVMIVAWVVSFNKASPAEPQPMPDVWQIYS
ncbi:MAG TPA: hypothetical protein VJR71_07655 [Pseudolabrys sp.]|nr:hypothetical protein [Pseudolabrys sp.]